MVFLSSCEEKIFTINVDCDECFTEEPDSADIVLEFSDKLMNDSGVPFVFYEGNIEDNNVLFIDTALERFFYVYAPVKKYYSVKAYYTGKDSLPFTVINGTKMKVKYVSEECYDPCWIVKKYEIDLRVHYQNYFE